jgi:hypothetical protein
MNNIIGKYITNTQNNFKKYLSLILKSKYDKNICDELIQTYIDARYYNYGVDNKIRIFYRRIYSSLRKKADELIKEEPRKKELIDNTVSLFQYFFYFDDVRDNVEVEKIVESIQEFRIFKLNLRSALTDDFKNEFLNLVVSNMKASKKFIEGHFTDDFELEIKKINPNLNNLYRVRLKYYFDFPEIFSKEVIQEVFDTDVVGEDKLFVEYSLLSVQALYDLLNANFNKIYICDFAVSLLGKNKKLDQILEILNNQAAQDKIDFEVSYEEFLENKDAIFKIMKKGFGFALKTKADMPKLSIDELILFRS